MKLEELIPVLQIAVGPVILISGVGLLLLTMTNRAARVVDRTREFIARQRNGVGDPAKNDAQLQILWKRACSLRTAIVFAASSALLAAAMVITLFVGAVAKWNVAWGVIGLFVACLAAMCLSLVLFLVDQQRSLRAISLELGFSRGRPKRQRRQ